MKKYLVSLMAMSSLTAMAQNLPNQDKLSNYMICNVEISKDGKSLSKHLVTTYRPSKFIMQLGSTPYHYPTVAVGHCVLEEFDKDFNKRTLSKSKGNYLDLCYRMFNGVDSSKDGGAEFYLVNRPVKNVLKMEYLNRNNPLEIVGTNTAEKRVDDYDITAECKNTMLAPVDSIWAKIKKDRLGDYDNTLK